MTFKTCPLHGTILAWREPCRICGWAPGTHNGTGAQSRHTRAWRRYSARIRAERPICERCKAAPSTQVHHIIDRAYGGDLFPGDHMVEALCSTCHARESADRQGHQWYSGRHLSGRQGSRGSGGSHSHPTPRQQHPPGEDPSWPRIA